MLRGWPEEPFEQQMGILADAERFRGKTAKAKLEHVKNIVVEANGHLIIAKDTGKDTTVAFTLFGRIMYFIYDEQYDKALDCAYQYMAESLRLFCNYDRSWENGWEGRGE